MKKIAYFLLTSFGVLTFMLLLNSCDSNRRQKSDLVYMKTLELFDKTNPGYGLDTAFSAKKLHYPMAYALFASAEAWRFRATGDQAALENAFKAARWLIENSDLDGDGEVGWGLPFAWDAGGDGSINPEHTEYTITTALVIQGLLDVYDAAVQTRRKSEASQFLATAIAAAETFINGRFDEEKTGIVFRYSTLPEDYYHVINASSMLVGQLQRLSRYSSSRSEMFSQLADRGALYILSHQQWEHGHIYWMYYGDRRPTQVKRNRPNDLVHEIYTFQGLLDYKVYGGRYGNLINARALLSSISRFMRGNKVFEFPQGYDYPKDLRRLAEHQWARLWGIGYALYFTTRLERCLGYPSNLNKKNLQYTYHELPKRYTLALPP